MNSVMVCIRTTEKTRQELMKQAAELEPIGMDFDDYLSCMMFLLIYARKGDSTHTQIMEIEIIRVAASLDIHEACYAWRATKGLNG